MYQYSQFPMTSLHSLEDWLKEDYWYLEDAIHIINGYEPNLYNVASPFRKIDEEPMYIAALDSIKRGELLVVSDSKGDLVKPLEFVKWAKIKGFMVAKELSQNPSVFNTLGRNGSGSSNNHHNKSRTHGNDLHKEIEKLVRKFPGKPYTFYWSHIKASVNEIDCLQEVTEIAICWYDAKGKEKKMDIRSFQNFLSKLTKQ